MENQKQEFRGLEAEEIAEVYEKRMKRDFPKSELKPLTAIIHMWEKGSYDCLGFYEEDRMTAYAFSVKDPEKGYLLLDYLAVCEEWRGDGHGSRCLEELRRFYRQKKGILLECESLESAKNESEIALRTRRIRFYEKNGCVRSGVRSRVFGVDFDILYLPLTKRQVDVSGELERLYRLMLSEDRYERWVRIWDKE